MVKTALERDQVDLEDSLLCAAGDKGQLLKERSGRRSQKVLAKGRALPVRRMAIKGAVQGRG